MRRGTGHLLALVIGTLLLGCGLLLLIIPILADGVQHSTTRDIIAACLVATGAVCVVPANMREAVVVFRPIIPFARRSSDRTRINPSVTDDERMDGR